MQIVIDIPKGHKFIGYYTYFDGLNLYHSGSDLIGLVELPEKHGRLIDADDIPWEKECDSCGDGTCTTHVIVNKYDVDDMPTIIEATEEK